MKSHPILSAEMVKAAQARIGAAGGRLTVWGVLREDRYETLFGDGFYLHLRGLALSKTAAQRLAALDADTSMTTWHVREYDLLFRDGRTTLASPLAPEEEFSVDDVIEILSEIAPGAEASALLIGSGALRRTAGPHMRSLG